MISRRSFFGGLAAACVAPAFVQRSLQYFGWKPYVVGIDFGIDFGSGDRTSVWSGDRLEAASAAEHELLKRRMNDVYAATRRNMARSLYGFPGAREQTVVRLTDMAEGRQYLTLRETLLERSERHFVRAAHWRIQGKPDYAMGSLHKAARAEDRARSLPL